MRLSLVQQIERETFEKDQTEIATLRAEIELLRTALGKASADLQAKESKR